MLQYENMNNIMKYNSDINIIGSIPDYASMIEYIIEEYTSQRSEYKSFQFRTTKSLSRFTKAINDSILSFESGQHEKLFYYALLKPEFSPSDKLLVVFWQMLFANALFRNITAEVFMKAVYQGKSALTQNDIYSFVRHLKEENVSEFNWAESTLKIIGSKYLTAMKKLGLADGNLKKEIKYPVISDSLFIYFIKWCQAVYPNDRTIENPYIQFGFLDAISLTNRLKRIDFIQFWDITQLGNEVAIDIKDYEQE